MEITIEDKKQMDNLAKSVFSGDEKMTAKTIYNFRNKTKDEIAGILMLEEQEFLKSNSGYKYDNYRYKDGPNGERTVYLIFKKQ